MATESTESVNFIQQIINEGREAGDTRKIHTRFPPEPNGYLHIGHCKSICINFGLAKENNGICSLRFDDTNPTKEDTEYVDAIMDDIHWLGFDWAGIPKYASDYFDDTYSFAETLILKGLAYVCSCSAEEIKNNRGTLTEPGHECPHRNRSVTENLDLFRRMKNGEFSDGEMVLRAKIDMASPNLNMRDPVIYRILHQTHHRTGDKWCIYPMYDFAHPIGDYLDGVTHSVCTLEFEDHRPLYDWTLVSLGFINEFERPRQIEFARLNITNTVMSKRFLRALVEEGKVSGWDDPRMSTLCGVRRLGYTATALKDFCNRIGIAKANSLVDRQLLEHCVREDLGAKASRVMAVLNPIKVEIENYPENQVEYVTAELHPEHPEYGSREIPFTREIYIDADDFMMDPPPKYFRLAPGKEVRLKNGYIIMCKEVITSEETGEIEKLICTYDPDTKSGADISGKKVKGTIQWVSAVENTKFTCRLYGDLLRPKTDGYEGEMEFNPDSLTELTECYAEKYMQDAIIGQRYQFIRLGYFIKDRDSSENNPVFNRIVSLKDSWAKEKK